MAIAAECVAAERESRALLRPMDELGRQVPHRLGVLAFASAIPGFMARFKEVDLGYADVENGVARLWCPCMGSAPAVPLGGFARCSRCGRLYVFSGRTLWAART